MKDEKRKREQEEHFPLLFCSCWKKIISIIFILCNCIKKIIIIIIVLFSYLPYLVVVILFLEFSHVNPKGCLSIEFQ